jgi:hypothetical protein
MTWHLVVARDRAGNVFAESRVLTEREALGLAAEWLRADPPALEVRRTS